MSESLTHVCGLSGFGALGDICRACEREVASLGCDSLPGEWPTLVRRLLSDLAAAEQKIADINDGDDQAKSTMIRDLGLDLDYREVAWSKIRERAAQKLAAAEAENERLREALRKFGRHGISCSYYDSDDEDACDCGWAEVEKEKGDAD